MERHIGLWDREYGNKTTVAELIIDGNHIEFYNRDVQGIALSGINSLCPSPIQ